MPYKILISFSPWRAAGREPSLRTTLALTDVLPRRSSGDGCTYGTGMECSGKEEAWPEGSKLRSLSTCGDQSRGVAQLSQAVVACCEALHWPTPGLGF